MENEYATSPYTKALLVLSAVSAVLATILAGYLVQSEDTSYEMWGVVVMFYLAAITAIILFTSIRSADKSAWVWKERAHRERAKAQKLQSEVSRLELEVSNLSKRTDTVTTSEYQATEPPILDFHRLDYAQGSLISHLHRAYRNDGQDTDHRGLYTDALAALLHCRQDEVTLLTCAREIHEWGTLLSQAVQEQGTAQKCLAHAMLFVGAQTRVEREREYSTLHKLLLDILGARTY